MKLEISLDRYTFRDGSGKEDMKKWDQVHVKRIDGHRRDTISNCRIHLHLQVVKAKEKSLGF